MIRSYSIASAQKQGEVTTIRLEPARFVMLISLLPSAPVTLSTWPGVPLFVTTCSRNCPGDPCCEQSNTQEIFQLLGAWNVGEEPSPFP